MMLKKIWEYEDYKLIQLKMTDKFLLILFLGENIITTSYDWDTMIKFIDKKVMPE